jgi:actin related protein 2/3 complex subunit 2
MQTLLNILIFEFLVTSFYLSNGAQQVLDRLFPGMETSPDSGFDVALQLDLDRLPPNPEVLLTEMSQIKRHILGGPLELAFIALEAKQANAAPVQIDFRRRESMFVCPTAGKVVVIFSVDFEDQFDQALAKVFLQQFMEAQRDVRGAPPIAYGKEPPRELEGMKFTHDPNSAGYISFALEPRHIEGPEKRTKAVTLLTGFRNYIHYHIKCSKTYLHMRMRKRVAGWLQVLNRAMPEVETEKKTATGKTFSRK